MLVLLLGGEFRSDAANTADQVASSAQEARPIAVGAAAPDAALRDLDGNDVTLNAIVAEKPTVLIFYRGSWCPYCNLQLSDLVKVEEELSLASSTCPAVGFGLTQDATSHASHCSARRLLNNLRQVSNKVPAVQPQRQLRLPQIRADPSRRWRAPQGWPPSVAYSYRTRRNIFRG